MSSLLPAPLLHSKRSGHGPVLVLIHGVAGSGAIWTPIMPYLNQHFTVIQLDLLGYGHSPKPAIDYTPHVHATAIHATLAHHNIEPPFILVGLSMGTLLALEYARLWPEEVSRVLCIGLPYYKNAAEARHRLRRSPWVRLALDWSGVGRVLLTTAWKFGQRHPSLAVAFSRGGMYTKDMAEEAVMASYQAFKTSLLHGMVHNRVEPLLAATAATPQAYLHGAHDRWTEVAEVKAVLSRYPQCAVTVLPDTDHNTVVSAPRTTAEWIVTHALSAQLDG